MQDLASVWSGRSLFEYLTNALRLWVGAYGTNLQFHPRPSLVALQCGRQPTHEVRH